MARYLRKHRRIALAALAYAITDGIYWTTVKPRIRRTLGIIDPRAV